MEFNKNQTITLSIIYILIVAILYAIDISVYAELNTVFIGLSALSIFVLSLYDRMYILIPILFLLLFLVMLIKDYAKENKTLYISLSIVLPVSLIFLFAGIGLWLTGSKRNISETQIPSLSTTPETTPENTNNTITNTDVGNMVNKFTINKVRSLLFK